MRALLQLPGLLAAILLSSPAPASAAPGPQSEAASTPESEQATSADRLGWWQDARFGLFIHWGLYSIPEGRWGESAGYGEWIRHSAEIPVAVYDRLVDRFEPWRFDARDWARLARAAGMGYVVITTKHHDGFCLWDSDATEFDTAATPFGRDVMAELKAACDAEGLVIGWYHSIMDWHHPDYLPRRSWEAADRSAKNARFERYVETLHAQVRELLTRYGPIGVMWFDGEWESTWTHERGQALYDLCRALQPEVIVNNRVDKGRGGMAGMTSDARYAGDFGTPEQEVPASGFPGVAWESCITLNRHWGWNAADTEWKSAETLIRLLVDVVSKGGNLLLNVGPRPDGTFPELAVERLEAIGRWMDIHAGAIHGTQANPVGTVPWGRITMTPRAEGARLNLCVFEWPADGRLLVPTLGNEAGSARLMADPAREFGVRREGLDLVVQLSGAAPDPVCSVVTLDLVGPPIPYGPPEVEAAADSFIGSRAVSIRPSSPLLEARYTLDGSEPTSTSTLATGPLELQATTTLRAATFHGQRRVSRTIRREFRKVLPRPGTVTGPRKAGLAYARYTGTFDAVPDFGPLVPTATGVATAIGWPPVTGEAAESEAAGEHQALLLEGFVRIPESGVWSFELTSDDGSRFWVDSELVVDNDGLHGARALSGTAALASGWHTVRIEYFNKTASGTLELRWARAGTPLEAIPNEALAHVAFD